MKIGNKEIENPIMLAPMAGVTDVGFRAVCSKFGADATVTEMLSARAMAHNPRKTEFMTITTDAEKVKIAQIFGHEPEYMQRAVKSPILEKFDGFDINMGCPAPKIVRNGEGAALLDNLSLAKDIICSVKNATDRPVSVKFRKGNRLKNYLEFARMCEDCGVDFITFHARTVAEGYAGHSDWEALAEVKAKVKIPVVGSGDVVDAKSLLEMRKTGVDGVMIGRGALGRPWIFAELNSNSSKKIEKIDKFGTIEEHISILRQHFEDSWLKLYIRKHLLWYAKDLPLASNLRLTLATCNDVDEALDILKEAFLKEV